MLNVGILNFGSGFYFYFTYGIKKCGLTCLSGFNESISTSYHGINFGLHSQGTGLSSATFLTNSDGSYQVHMITLQDILNNAGAYGNIVKIGHDLQIHKLIRLDFRL